MESLRIDEQQRHNPTSLDRHYSNDDTRINMYDYMKTSDPNSNRLSAPDYSGLKQSFPLSNSLTDLCGGMHVHAGYLDNMTISVHKEKIIFKLF